MEWISGLNSAMDYVEENLEGEIITERAAQLAACSVYHFQRMFTYITGVPLGEYIRRRRMTLAAFEMVNGAKVIDLALKYGYESPTAFNRAFQSVHGISPSKAKSEGISLTAFPRLTFTVSIKGEKAMNYKIEKKSAFRVVGYALEGKMTSEESMARVPLFWQEVGAKGGIAKLCALMDGSGPNGILGVCGLENGDFSGYYIAVASSAPVPEGMAEYTVPEATFAIFEAIGPTPAAIQSVQQRIITEWLPSSGYEYAPAPDIEVYSDGDQSSESYYSEVWLPIIKK